MRKLILFIFSLCLNIKRISILLFIFRLSCLLIFIYQTWYLFEVYSRKRTLSDIGFIKQDRYPLPSICITSKQFSYDSFNNTFNVTNDEYAKGKWKVYGLSEKELWDFLSPTLPNLIRKIEVYKILEYDSEKYSKVKISVKNLPGFGVDIERMDYYYNPRIFCLSFRNVKVSARIVYQNDSF